MFSFLEVRPPSRSDTQHLVLVGSHPHLCVIQKRTYKNGDRIRKHNRNYQFVFCIFISGPSFIHFLIFVFWPIYKKHFFIKIKNIRIQTMVAMYQLNSIVFSSSIPSFVHFLIFVIMIDLTSSTTPTTAAASALMPHLIFLASLRISI